MAKYVITTPQTLAAIGNAAIWQNTECQRKCAPIRNRGASGKIRLAGGTCCHPITYCVNLHLNVSGLVGTISIGLYQDGDELPTARIYVVPGGAADIWSVNTATEIVADCGCTDLSVRTLTAGVTINSGEFIIKKKEDCKC